MVKVLYEDNHIIAVVKPAGILSQADKSGDVSIYEIVKDYIRIKKGKPSLFEIGNAKPRTKTAVFGTGVFLGIVHRLDRPVSGIMLFAKTSKGASRLSEQFRNRRVEKTYHAIVSGKPKKDKGKLINVLGKDGKTLKARAFTDGKEARLYYEVITSNGEYSLMKIKIEGGQFHQIRSQLSLAGFPILGDVKYLPAGRQVEGKWDNPRAIALCATGLFFKAATTEEIIALSIDIPKEWDKYLSTGNT